MENINMSSDQYGQERVPEEDLILPRSLSSLASRERNLSWRNRLVPQSLCLDENQRDLSLLNQETFQQAASPSSWDFDEISLPFQSIEAAPYSFDNWLCFEPMNYNDIVYGPKGNSACDFDFEVSNDLHGTGNEVSLASMYFLKNELQIQSDP